MRLSILKRFHLFPHVCRVIVLGWIIRETRVQDAASRSALPNSHPRCHAARSCRFDIPTVLGGKRPNVAAHMQLGGFTLKAKTSCNITSPPNLRKANLRCDAGLLSVSSLSLFFCSVQDAVLALHGFYRAQAARIRSERCQIGAAPLRMRQTDARIGWQSATPRRG